MIETVLTAVVVAALGTWLVLTAACQLPLRRLARLQVLDRFGLIPRWNFFAPSPGTSDYHLLVRDHFADGVAGQWQELDLRGPPRTHAAALWNPDKRTPKALFDVTGMLIRCAGAREAPDKTVSLSVPYLMLLNAAASRPCPPLAVGRQFLLMKTDGPGGAPQLLFMSNMHEV